MSDDGEKMILSRPYGLAECCHLTGTWNINIIKYEIQMNSYAYVQKRNDQKEKLLNVG